MRIAKATREGRWGKVKASQWLLIHSSSAKLLAVRRVVRNRGWNPARVDGVIWTTPAQPALERAQRNRKHPPDERRVTV